MVKNSGVYYVDWKRKLSSRKLWLSVAAFVTSLMIFNGAEPDTAEAVAAIIMNGATVIAYVLAEGFADGKNS